jgi:hypothetical protein
MGESWRKNSSIGCDLTMNPTPKIVFLIPIASARSVKNWPAACNYLQQTLASVFNSASPDFRVVVAGHEAPDFKLPEDARFKFLALDHPVSGRDETTWNRAVQDKMMKLAAAWDYAKTTWHPHYVMKLDWDDLISSRLVSWLVSAPEEAGYRISQGWIWRGGTGHFIQHTDGTQFDAAGQRAEKENLYSLVPGAATGTLLLNDSHSRAEAQFEYLGQKLVTVPFSAAVYRIGHGNNSTGQYHRTQTLRMLLGRLRRTRLITGSLRKEFMLE